MAFLLLVSTFVISFVVSSLVVFIFHKPIAGILYQVIPMDIGYRGTYYLLFAIYGVGIGGGGVLMPSRNT